MRCAAPSPVGCLECAHRPPPSYSVQINRADKDSDAEIECVPLQRCVRSQAILTHWSFLVCVDSLPEWLSFSSMLAKLPIETFRTTLAGYMEKLDKLAEEESKTE